MLDELKKNVETEIEILKEIAIYMRRLDYASGAEARIIYTTIGSLKNALKILNNSIPDLIDNVGFAKKLSGKEKSSDLENVTYRRIDSDLNVVLKSKDRERFLKELSISESLIRKIKKKETEEKERFAEFKAARGYVKLSNKFFLEKSKELIEKNYFSSLSINIKKANLDILFEAYVAMLLFTTVISIFVGFLLFVFLLFFNIGFTWPIIGLYTGGFLIRLAQTFWIPFVVPIATFLILYLYPSTERTSISKKIDQELPFAVIHMSAISGSGIEPSEIFKIIGFSKEYPYLRREMRKVLNQINLYGYDLLTALTNVSKSSPSAKLSELFSGLATTIGSGGGLQEYFERRAESLLIDYRLEREKYTKVAETFMDIYISVVIAAPMILMLLLVMMSITGFQSGFTTQQITLLIIGVIAIINTLFLVFLEAKQPIY